MKKFHLNATGYSFPYSHPRDVIEAFRSIQHEKIDYDAFFREFKRRLRIFTGDEAVSFYDEQEAVTLLERLGEITFKEEVS